MHLIVQRVEKDLDQRVRVKTVHFVFTFDPGLFVIYLSAPLWQVVKVLWGSTEVLHTVSIVTVGPVMLLVQDWAERCFVAIQ
jgi:hypothetical protein